jgi:hypothetical protein
MPTTLTARDTEILTALTRHVRVFSLSQIATTWWATSSTRVSENRLKQLVTLGLIQIDHTVAHPEIELPGPLFTWHPGEADPHLGALSHALRSRWTEHPALTTCVSATKLAAERFGGHGGRPPRAVERTHDIHFAKVYLHYRRTQPETLAHWVFEEKIKFERKLAESGFGEKLPDALLRFPGRTHAVEFGGAYPKDKLSAFHGYCKDQHYSYEVW